MVHNKIRIIEPAAPYPEPGSVLPKYNAKPDFPIVNKSEVKNAPIHTVRHLTLISGRYLNISANNTAIILSEKTKLNNLKNTNKDSDQFWATHVLKIEMTDETKRDISNKKPIETINPKEKTRVLT